MHSWTSSSTLTESDSDSSLSLSRSFLAHPSLRVDRVQSPKDLAAFIYPGINGYQPTSSSLAYFKSRVILCSNYSNLKWLNQTLFERVPGEVHEQKSVNEVTEHGTWAVDTPKEFLSSIDVEDIPPAVLKLKVGCPLVLLSDVTVSLSRSPPHRRHHSSEDMPLVTLSKGTRFIFLSMQSPYTMEVQIINGKHHGEHTTLPRTCFDAKRDMNPKSKSKVPVGFRRKQFPVRLGFAVMLEDWPLSGELDGGIVDLKYAGLDLRSSSSVSPVKRPREEIIANGSCVKGELEEGLVKVKGCQSVKVLLEEHVDD